MRKSVHSEDYQILLDMLKEIRENQHLTQTELARRLDSTQSAVSKIERGERRLDLVELRAWCQLGLKIPLLPFIEEFEKVLAKGRPKRYRAKNVRNAGR